MLFYDAPQAANLASTASKVITTSLVITEKPFATLAQLDKQSRASCMDGDTN